MGIAARSEAGIPIFLPPAGGWEGELELLLLLTCCRALTSWEMRMPPDRPMVPSGVFGVLGRWCGLEGLFPTSLLRSAALNASGICNRLCVGVVADPAGGELES